MGTVTRHVPVDAVGARLLTGSGSRPVPVDAMKRRVYIIALFLVLLSLPVVFLANAPGGSGVRPTVPALFVLVLAGIGALHWQWLPVQTIERATVLVVPLLWLVRLSADLYGSGGPPAAWDQLTTTVQPGLMLLLVVVYLAFDPSDGLRLSLTLYAAFGLVIGGRMVPALLAGEHLEEAMKFLHAGVFLGAAIALLYVLAHLKEQLARTTAEAAQLATLATTDPLTGLANRRRLEEVLVERARDSRRYGRPLSVVIFDIDHFKRLNDAYGHAAGDEVLRRLMTVLRDDLRVNDVLGRWGGEEFLVVMPETRLDEAEQVANRWRTALATYPFPDVGMVTASFGAACYGVGDTDETVVARADKALYLSKTRGRNRVSAVA